MTNPIQVKSHLDRTFFLASTLGTKVNMGEFVKGLDSRAAQSNTIFCDDGGVPFCAVQGGSH